METRAVQPMPNITSYTALWVATVRVRQISNVASYRALYAGILEGRPMSNVASYTSAGRKTTHMTTASSYSSHFYTSNNRSFLTW
jgi:hypothetical protein